MRGALAAAGLAASSVRPATPTLENAFVAILRELEEERQVSRVSRAARDGGRRGESAIGARGLRKAFGDFAAVKGLDLEVRYGEVYGLLGANGAGKTTTIKMLCGLIEPTRGRGAAGRRGGRAALRAACGSRWATCRRSSRSTTT